MKVCFKCGQEKEYSEFAKNAKRSDGYQSQCRECQKQYRRDHYQSNKQKYIDKASVWREQEKIKFFSWLSQQSCVDCGNDDYRVLEFDHLSDKEYTISQKIGMVTFEVLMSEIAKCEIVCANCHKIRTATRGNFYKFMRY